MSKNSRITIQAPLHSTEVTKKGDFVHRFVLGDKIVKVWSKENNLKPGQFIQMDINLREDSTFPMVYEKQDTRVFSNQEKPQSGK